MVLKACYNCASIEQLEWIGKSTAEAGLVLLGSHLTGTYSCTRCGYNGLPLEFDKEEDYKAYYKEREGVWKPIIGKIPIASKMAYGYLKIMLMVALAIIAIMILLNIIAIIF